jgi:hypothetical protein
MWGKCELPLLQVKDTELSKHIQSAKQSKARSRKTNLPDGLLMLPPWCDPPLLRNDAVAVGAAGLGGRGDNGGSKISLYFDTISTEMK